MSGMERLTKMNSEWAGRYFVAPTKDFTTKKFEAGDSPYYVHWLAVILTVNVLTWLCALPTR